jgi:hypothetical protein
MKSNPLRYLILLLTTLGLFSSSKAQTGPPSTYSFYAYNETYNYLSGGTTIPTLTGQDDVSATGIPIGFNFLFAGTNYSTLTVNTNGWLSFNSITYGYYNDNHSPSYADLSALGPCLLPFWDDPMAGTVTYTTTGTAPNRVFTVEFKDFEWDFGGTTPVISFQVRLYEGGVIKFHYKQESGTVYNSLDGRFGLSVGIATGTSSYQFLNSTGTSPTTITSGFGSTQWSITTRPVTGQVYQFGDFPCNAAPTPVLNSVTSTTAHISWNAMLPSINYEYFWSTSATPPATGTTTTGLTFSQSGLTPNTQYYFHLRNKCTSTQFTSWITLPVKTNPPCTKPVGLRIKNLYLDSATVEWQTLTHALGYTYVVNTERNDPTSTTATQTTANGSISAKPLLEGTTYYVHIRVNCPGGEVSDWLLDSFRTPIKCRAPQLKVDYEHIDRAVVYWDWVPSAIAYEYEVSQSPTPLGKGTEIMRNTFFAYPLKPGEVYYFHVKSKCLDQGRADVSEWGTTSFKTFPLSVNNVTGAGSRIYAYPNPVKDIITLRAEDYKGRQGNIVVTDIAGKTVYTGILSSESMEIDMRSLAKGVYLLKYTDAENVQTIKLVKE